MSSSNKSRSKTIHYKNLVFTNHAYGRSLSRSITKENIYQTVNTPNQKITLPDNKFKFIKEINDRQIQIIATKLPNSQQWLIVSVWVRGEADRPSLIWQILSLPFKLGWLMLKILLSIIKKLLACVTIT